MGLPDLIVVIALVLAAVDVWDSRGRSATAWAVVLVCVSLLWHLLPL